MRISTTLRQHFVIANTIVMLAYSISFILLNGPYGELDKIHGLVLGLHLVSLVVFGQPNQLHKREVLTRLLASAMVVGIVGGLLWFYNAMSHMH
jgi:hypothetical protein